MCLRNWSSTRIDQRVEGIGVGMSTQISGSEKASEWDPGLSFLWHSHSQTIKEILRQEKGLQKEHCQYEKLTYSLRTCAVYRGFMCLGSEGLV